MAQLKTEQKELVPFWYAEFEAYLREFIDQRYEGLLTLSHPVTAVEDRLNEETVVRESAILLNESLRIFLLPASLSGPNLATTVVVVAIGWVMQELLRQSLDPQYLMLKLLERKSIARRALRRRGLEDANDVDDLFHEIIIKQIQSERLGQRIDSGDIPADLNTIIYRAASDLADSALFKQDFGYFCGRCEYFNSGASAKQSYCTHQEHFEKTKASALHVTASTRPSAVGVDGCKQFTPVRNVNIDEVFMVTVADGFDLNDKYRHGEQLPGNEEHNLPLQMASADSENQAGALRPLTWQSVEVRETWEEISARMSSASRERLLDFRIAQNKIDSFNRMAELNKERRTDVFLFILDCAKINQEEIASGMNRSREWVTKRLNGTTRKTRHADGKSFTYREPAGALRYACVLHKPGPGKETRLRKLEIEHPLIHAVVRDRDFYLAAKEEFASIARERLSGKKQSEAIELYLRGWAIMGFPLDDGVTADDGDAGETGSAGGGENVNDQEPGPLDRRGSRSHLSSVIHPSNQLLLDYGERTLLPDVHQVIGEHLLICPRCIAELEFIETEILMKAAPETDEHFEVVSELSIGAIQREETSAPEPSHPDRLLRWPSLRSWFEDLKVLLYQAAEWTVLPAAPSFTRGAKGIEARKYLLTIPDIPNDPTVMEITLQHDSHEGKLEVKVVLVEAPDEKIFIGVGREKGRTPELVELRAGRSYSITSPAPDGEHSMILRASHQEGEQDEMLIINLRIPTI